MRLVTFSTNINNQMRTGVVVDDEIVDLTDPTIGLPGDMSKLLALGEAGLAAAHTATTGPARRFLIGEVSLCSPIAMPPKILGIGMNYRDHVAELGRQAPEYQYWFNKQRTSISHPGAPILIPRVSNQVDYEGELAMIIGRFCQNVPKERAMEVVAGFSVINDVSVRDWQWRTPTFTLGKSFNSHAPLGPWMSTPDEVGDVTNLAIRTWVNDELRQNSSTAELIFNPAEMIAYLTSAFPLEPGDIIATGTPAGVGAGFDPPKWLEAGDTVRIEIEGIGTLENPVEKEEAISPLL